MRVDVVIPCYNYARYLPGCVESVLAQRDVEVRALVIDDCSSDDTPEVLDRLVAADPRVQGRRHPVNRGHIATYNEGLLEWADSDLVVLLSADDLLAPGALDRAAAVFADHPTVGVVYGRSVYYQQDPPRTAHLPLGASVWPGRQWIGDRCRTAKNVISSPEVVMRTAVQHRIGGYRPDLPHAGDLEMWLRAAAVSDVGYVRGRTHAYYRVHDQSMSRTTYAGFLADLRQRRDVFDRFLAEHRDRLTDPDHLGRSAGRALARDALWIACRAYDRDRLADVPVEALVDFAGTAFPDVEQLPEYRALQRRRRLGPRLCSRTQLFVGAHVLRQGRERARRELWKWRGV